MKKALPKIRQAYDSSKLRAQYQDGSTFKDFSEVVGKYANGDPIGICLEPDIAETLDFYNVDVWWSFGIAVFASEGIIEIVEDELLDFAKLQYIHQAWFRRSDKAVGQAWFEQTLWELEDKYDAFS